MPTKVLVVDDDEPLCKLVARVMKEKGLLARTAYDGEQALAMFQEEPPDVMILDVAMPGKTGFEVAAEIRQMEPPDHRTIIVILTAYSRSYFASKDLEVDIDSFLTKPIMPTDLIAHISGLLAH